MAHSVPFGAPFGLDVPYGAPFGLDILYGAPFGFDILFGAAFGLGIHSKFVVCLATRTVKMDRERILCTLTV